jgi:hypothetical protein
VGGAQSWVCLNSSGGFCYGGLFLYVGVWWVVLCVHSRCVVLAGCLGWLDDTWSVAFGFFFFFSWLCMSGAICGYLLSISLMGFNLASLAVPDISSVMLVRG